MTYQIICQTPELAATLSDLFVIEGAIQESNIRIAQQAANGARFVVIDAGFPRKLFLVWDCQANDNLRGDALGKRDARFPYFTRASSAQKVADRHNRRMEA